MQENVPLSPYNREQAHALAMVRDYLVKSSPEQLNELSKALPAYLAFRSRVESFLRHHFSAICTRACFESRLSACCSHEGIIVFFADVVINAIRSTTAELDQLRQVLQRNSNGHRCVFLGSAGCRWRLKPIVCEMFLCPKAEQQVLGTDPPLKAAWEQLKRERKRFTWPNRPVLFNDLEAIFIRAGYHSPLMYLHNSPGMLRLKQRAGIGPTSDGG